MAQTWTDTTYKLDGTEMTILTTHEGLNQVSLYIPGYSLDGRGFSVYFSQDHIELLEDLLSKLKQLGGLSVACSERSRTGVNACAGLTRGPQKSELPAPVRQKVPVA